jgi:putative MATE family efflux protein
MVHINELGEEKVLKLLIKYSVPAIVGMVVNALYNIIDRIFIGNSKDLGPNGIAGITLCFPIMIILLAIGILFGIGGSTLFSLRLGQNKQEEAQEAMGNALAGLLLSGFLFMIVGQIFLKPIMIKFGASDAVMPYAIEYMRVIFFGAVFQVVSMGMNNFIRADGNPKVAMLTMFLGAGLNIILDPLFIYVFRMGMAGAALATILAQMVSCIWVVSYFLSGRCNNKLKFKYIKIKLKVFITIISLGLPGFLLQLANSLLNAILNKNLYLYSGDIGVSVMGIINSIQTLLLMPIIGIRQGMQPVISYNFGAKKYSRVKTAVLLASFVATIIVIMGYIMVWLIPEQLIGLFNRDKELIDFGKAALISWMLLLPVVGFQIIASNFFQAIGKSKSAMFLTLTRQVIFLIPALIIFPKIWGLEGLLYSAPFADFFSTLLTGVWFFVGIKKLGANQT